jgi:hypothetical protein
MPNGSLLDFLKSKGDILTEKDMLHFARGIAKVNNNNNNSFYQFLILFF